MHREEMWPAVMCRPGVLHSFSQWQVVWWERLGPQRWIHRAVLQCCPRCLEFAVICSDALGILWRRQDARIEGCFPIDPTVPGSSSILSFLLVARHLVGHVVTRTQRVVCTALICDMHLSELYSSLFCYLWPWNGEIHCLLYMWAGRQPSPAHIWHRQGCDVNGTYADCHGLLSHAEISHCVFFGKS